MSLISSRFSAASSKSRSVISKSAGKKRAIAIAAAAAVSMAAPGMQQIVSAASFYWTGNNAGSNAWNATTGLGGDNWSSSPSSRVTPSPLIPGAVDDVFFYEQNSQLSNVLGADFSIRSLNFTAANTSAVTIGGANLLTIGSGGINVFNGATADILNTQVAIGTSETWTNNGSVLTLNGVVSGASGSSLTIAGTGLTGYNFTAANTYSGSTTLSTAGSQLTLSGTNGSILNTSAITLNGGSVLNLDNSTANNTNRIADTLGITSNGGTLNLLGNSGASSTESIGTLTLGSGLTNVNVTPGASQTAALTIGTAGTIPSFGAHVAGASVNFGGTGTVSVPNVTLSSGIIGGWATIGNINSNSSTNSLDLATVTGGNVVAYTGYTNTNTLADFVTGNNVKESGGTQASPTAITLTAPTTTINSLYLTGASTLYFGSGSTGTVNSTNALVISSGVIISNGATITQGFNNQPNLATTALIGSQIVTGAASGAAGGTGFEGTITSGNGQDLIVDTASNLQIDSIITNNGNTSIGLTKNGSGILDLSDGNNQAQTVTGEIHNTFTGSVTINGGTLLTNDDLNLGAAPGSFKANAIILNGGTLLTTRGYAITGNRGITVGPQGGTLAYEGGATWTLASPITGSGSITFSSVPLGYNQGNSNTVALGFGNGANSYTGATTFNLVAPGGQGANIIFNGPNQIPNSSPVTLTGNQGNGGLNFNNQAETFGSLASAAGVGVITNLGTFVTGQNNLSTSYGGTIAGNGSFTKIGSGTQILAGNTSYTGATAIGNSSNVGGALLVNAAMSGTSGVTVGFGTTQSGTLGGTGSITAPVNVTGAGHLAPSNSAGTTTSNLTIAGNLIIASGATFDYNFGLAGTPGTSDLITISGNNRTVTLTGTDILNIRPVTGTFGIGTYNLISLTGTGDTFTDNATFTINGSNSFNYAVAATSNALRLTVTAGNPSLTWIGNVSNKWQVGGDQNWNTGSAAAPFANGNNVTFDDNGINNNVVSGQTTVAVDAGGVSPNTITVSNSSGSYSIGGGAISVTGTAGSNVSSTGTVKFTGTVTTPLTTISGGTFTVGATTGNYTSTTTNVSGGTLDVFGTLSTPTLALTGEGGLLIESGATLTGNPALSLASTSTATFSNSTQSLVGLTNAGAITLTGTALSLSGTNSITGTIGGTGSLAVTGGTTTLSNASGNTYGGGTTVSGGTLIVSNSSGLATGSNTVQVTGGTLTGTGIAGAVAVSGTGVLAPGAGVGSAGTITLNSLVAAAGATLNYTLASPASANSFASVTGTASFSGAENLLITEQAGFGVGTYTLVTAAGGLTDTATFTTTATPASGVLTYSVQQVGNSLNLVVDASSVTWTGATNSTWDTTTANWSPSPTGTFTTNQKAVFDDSLTVATNNNVTVVAGGVSTSGVTFNNNSIVYSVGGGAIGGLGGLTVNGIAGVTLTGANTYTGVTTLHAGTLNVSTLALGGVASAIGQSTNAAANLVFTGGTLQYTGATAQTTDRLFTIGAGGATLDASGSAAAGTVLFNNTGPLGIASGASTSLTLTGTNAGNYATVNNAENIAFSSVAAAIGDPAAGGTTSVSKTAAGGWTLSGSSSYTGGTTVQGGILQIQNGSALGTGSVSVAGGAQVAININTGTVANAFTLNGLFSNGTTNGALAYQFANPGTDTLTGTITLAATSNVATSYSDKTLVLSGKITGQGGLQVDVYKPGTATSLLFAPVIALSNTTNDFAGGLVVNGGSVLTNAVNVIPFGSGTGDVALNSTVVNNGTVTLLGTLNLNGNSQNINGLNGVGVVTAGSGTPTLTLGNNNATGSFSGVLNNTGTLALVKTGSGTETLTGASSYTGGTTINGGTITTSADNNLGASAGGVAISNGATLAINTNAVTGTHDITIGTGGGTLAVANSYTLSGAASLLDGSGALTKTGAGNLVVGGTNGFTGAINANVGKVYVNGPLTSSTVTVAGGATLGGTGRTAAVTLADTGIIEAGQSLSGQLTVASLAYTNTGAVNIGNLSNYPAGTTGSPSTAAVDDLGTFTSGEVVTFNLNGSIPAATSSYALLDYTGTVNPLIALGTYTSGTRTQTPTLSTVQLGNGNEEVQVNIVSDYIRWSGAADHATWDIDTTNTGGAGTNNWVLGSNASTPTAFRQNDVVVFDDLPGADQTVNIVPASVSPSSTTFNNNSVNYTIGGGSIAGTGALVKNGTATTTLNGSNTYSGGTTISAGTLAVKQDSALGAVPASATASNITINGGTLSVLNGTTAGTPTISTTRGITLGASGGTINIPFFDNNTASSHNGGELSLNYMGVITGTGGLMVTGIGGLQYANVTPTAGVGSSVLDLQASATYQGNTTINNAVVEAGAYTNAPASVINILPATTVLTLVNHGAFNLQDSASNQTVAGLTGDANTAVGTSNGSTGVVFTINNTNDYTYNGSFGGYAFNAKNNANGATLSLVKSGGGTQYLTGASNFGGSFVGNGGTVQTGTTINGGTLRVNNASGNGLGSGFVAINNGGTLGGSGSTGTGAVTIASGGTITAGANAVTTGTLTTGSQTWNPGGNYNVKTNDTAGGGVSNDSLTIPTLTLAAAGTTPFTVHLQSYGGTSPTTFTALQNLGGSATFIIANVTSVVGVSDITATSGTVQLTGTNNGTAVPDNNLFALDTSNFLNNTGAAASNQALLEFVGNGNGTGGSLEVVYNATPEPGTMMLVLGGIAPLLMGRRRRRTV